MKKRLGIYLHIPFCRQKCLYCDFCSFPRYDEETPAQYIAALRRELLQYAAHCGDYTVDSVYFGGGTPTLLKGSALVSILETIDHSYRLDLNAEITAECNPATGGYDSFCEMRKGGFNRLSIGLQSIHDRELRALGRIHSYSEFEKTFFEARRAGFDNISADLMSGIPLQTTESFLASVKGVCALSPEHISVYGLIVEENTPFGQMGDRLILPSEEAAREMYFAGIELLDSKGYKQYEISNFARCGYESRHNLKYWNCEEFLGVGLTAYSDFGGARFGNSEDLDAYLTGGSIEALREYPTASQRKNEYVMLRLRLCDGVDANDFARRFGEDFEETFGSRLARYVCHGLTEKTSVGWRLTPKGFYVSNAVLSEILDFSE